MHLPTLSTVNILQWLRDTIPSQIGKTVLITGANTGIGYWTAHVFAQFGAQVILACRSTTKAEQAISRIREDHPNALCDSLSLDLASETSIQEAVQTIYDRYDSLDILINNAGISTDADSFDQHGIHSTFSTNHLGPFSFTVQLLPLILATPKARIVTQSSLTHHTCLRRPDFRQYVKPFNRQPHAYAHSKLANLLFARHLRTILRLGNYPQYSLAAHPGLTLTQINHLAHSTSCSDFVGDLTTCALNRMALRFANLSGFCQPYQIAGALPAIYAAACDLNPDDFYFGPNRLFELSGMPTRAKLSGLAKCPNLAQSLWEISEEYTKIKAKV